MLFNVMKKKNKIPAVLSLICFSSKLESSFFLKLSKPDQLLHLYLFSYNLHGDPQNENAKRLKPTEPSWLLQTKYPAKLP